MLPLLDKLGRVLLPLLTPFDERDEVERNPLGRLPAGE
jgi:hypothetical protein